MPFEKKIMLSMYNIEFTREQCIVKGFVNKDMAVEYFPKYLESKINFLAYPLGLEFRVDSCVNCETTEENQKLMVGWEF